MSNNDSETRLGGRLPLLDKGGLNAAQKELWNSMGADAGRLGYNSKTADGRFIGPFNPMLRSPQIALTFQHLQADEAKFTSLSARVRQVVVLSVGSLWKAPYELYAHSAAAHHVGFSDTCVAALAAGQPNAELTAEETLAQRLSLALAGGHAVDDRLYADALKLLEEKGLVDFAVLVGCYQLVCGVLNLFAVPAPTSA